LNLDADIVDQFYHALKNFAEILHSERNLVEINLRAGDVVETVFKAVNQACLKQASLCILPYFRNV